MRRTIFVRRAHQFDSTSECWANLSVKYQTSTVSVRIAIGMVAWARGLTTPALASTGEVVDAITREALQVASDPASSKVATSISMPNCTFASAKYPSGSRWFKSEAM